MDVGNTKMSEFFADGPGTSVIFDHGTRGVLGLSVVHCSGNGRGLKNLNRGFGAYYVHSITRDSRD